MSDHYDVIIIGSGPGGGSVAHRLAPTGKRILLLERGDYLPRIASQLGFADGVRRRRLSGRGDLVRRAMAESFHPGLHYYVGGNSKVYGAALFRMRERDFDEIVHKDGLSPAWPLKYDAFEPYYAAGGTAVPRSRTARRGSRTSRRRAGHFPIRRFRTSRGSRRSAIASRSDGLHPFHLPLGILLDEKNGKPTPTSICIRCDAFDGFPCLFNGKADAQVICVDPTLKAHPNVTLLTGAYVSRLETDASGRTVTAVRVPADGQRGTILGRHRRGRLRCAVVGAAAVAIRERSHPNGLANGSGQVGRNYMRHNQSILMALMREAQRHRVSEDARGQRLLFRFGRLGLSARSHSDVCQIPR